MSKLRNSLQRLADDGWNLKDVINLLESIEKEDSRIEEYMLSTDERVVKNIKTILNRFCITQELKGHCLLTEAILMVFRKEFCIYENMEVLYEKLAIKMGTTSTKAQRAMRTVMETRWEFIKKLPLGFEIFGETIENEKHRLSTKCFIKQM